MSETSANALVKLPSREGRSRGQSGITIVELLVAVAVLGAVLSALAAGMIAIQRSTTVVDVRTENIGNAHIAMSVLSRDIRAASQQVDGGPAFTVADADEAQFHALLGDRNTPVRLKIVVDDDDRIVETSIQPAIDPVTGAVSYPVGDEQERFVASYVFNAVDEPLFEYFALVDGEPASLGSSVACDPTDADGDPCNDIQLVRLDLRISRDLAARTVPQRVTTEVRLPNLGSQQ